MIFKGLGVWIEMAQKLIVPWQLRREYERYNAHLKQGQKIPISGELQKFLIDLELEKQK